MRRGGNLFNILSNEFIERMRSGVGLKNGYEKEAGFEFRTLFLNPFSTYSTVLSQDYTFIWGNVQ